jgi:serine/threonine protein kinase
MNELHPENLYGRKKTLSISIDLDMVHYLQNTNPVQPILQEPELSNSAYYKPGSTINEINKINEANFQNLTKIQPQICAIIIEIVIKMGIQFDENNIDRTALVNDFKNYSFYLQNSKKILIGPNNNKCSVNSGVFFNGGKVLKLYNYEKMGNEWVKYKYMREVALQQYARKIMVEYEGDYDKYLNIPIILNYGEYENGDKLYFFIIMEFVAGTHFENKDECKLNIDVRRRLSAGINILYGSKLSHEDLRIANVLFDSNSGIISLIDFGEAILTDKSMNEPYVWNCSNRTGF